MLFRLLITFMTKLHFTQKSMAKIKSRFAVKINFAGVPGNDSVGRFCSLFTGVGSVISSGVCDLLLTSDSYVCNRWSLTNACQSRYTDLELLHL